MHFARPQVPLSLSVHAPYHDVVFVTVNAYVALDRDCFGEMIHDKLLLCSWWGVDLPQYVVPHSKLDSPVNFEKPAAAPQLAQAADS